MLRAAHQRRRHRGRGPAGAAARAARRSTDVELAVIAPDGNRSATARSITTRRPAVGRGGRRSATAPSATRRDGTPVDCVRLARARPDRGLRARPDRLRHQPRRQPRRRHHLLRHGRRGARGRRARPPGDRRLAAVAARARWTSGSASGFDFDDRRGVHRAASSTELDDVPLPDGHAAQRQRPGRRRRAASRSRGSASASTATSSTLVEEEDGRRRYRIYGDAPVYDDEPGTDLAAVAAGRIAVTPLHFDLTDRARHRGAARATTSRGCSRRPREEVAE